MMRPTALGAHVFAGGFTEGMKQHFDVLAHLECSNYGVATTRRNHPGLEVRVSKAPAGWHAEDFRGRVDVVYGNPPCAVWSSAGVKVGVPKRDYTAGYDPRDLRVAWFRSAFGLLELVAPQVLVLESVVRCWTAGRPFVDEHIRAAAALGYGTDVILLNGLDCGVPQHRRRVFLVFTKLAIAWARPDEPGPKTVRAALAGLVDPAPTIQPCTATELACVKITPPGGHLKDAYATLYGDTRVGEHRPGQYGGRMSFLEVRLDPDRPSRTWLGGPRFYHPTEDRRLSVREAAALCGYPPSYEFVGSVGDRYKQVAQAVMPPVGRWLGRQLAAAVSAGRGRANLDLRVFDWLTPNAGPHEEDVMAKTKTMTQQSSGAAATSAPTALDAAALAAARNWLSFKVAEAPALTCLRALDVLEQVTQRLAPFMAAPAVVAVTAPAPAPAPPAPPSTYVNPAGQRQHQVHVFREPEPAPAQAAKGLGAARADKDAAMVAALPPADPAVVARFMPRAPDGGVKPRAGAELIRAMVMTGEFTDAEIAATAKAVYPDLSPLVYKYPGETRYRLKKAGLNPPPPRAA